MSTTASSAIRSAVLRALSPSSQGVVNALTDESSFGGNSAKVRQEARLLTLTACNSVNEVIALVPGDYAHVLREPLLEVASSASKLMTARATLTKWRGHQAAGTFPPHLQSKVPEVQLTKGYRESGDGAERIAALATHHRVYIEQSLVKAIAAKEKDVEFLQTAVSGQTIFLKARPLLAAEAARLEQTRKAPVTEVDAEDNLNVTDWVVDPSIKKAAEQLLFDVPAYVFRIVSIVEAIDFAAQKKVEKKKKLAESADVEMADATKPGPSLQSMVDTAVSKATKKLATATKKKGGKTQSSTSKDSRTPAAKKGDKKKKPARISTGGKPPRDQRKKKAAGKGKKDKGKARA